MNTPGQHAIGDVCARTGINPVTLRAWERRHGLIRPARSHSGHRIYSDSDIETIREIQRWITEGFSIGQIKPILQNQSKHTDLNDSLQLLKQAARALAARDWFVLTAITEQLFEQPISTLEKDHWPALTDLLYRHCDGDKAKIKAQKTLLASFLVQWLSAKVYQLNLLKKQPTAYLIGFQSQPLAGWLSAFETAHHCHVVSHFRQQSPLAVENTINPLKASVIICGLPGQQQQDWINLVSAFPARNFIFYRPTFYQHQDLHKHHNCQVITQGIGHLADAIQRISKRATS